PTLANAKTFLPIDPVDTVDPRRLSFLPQQDVQPANRTGAVRWPARANARVTPSPAAAGTVSERSCDRHYHTARPPLAHPVMVREMSDCSAPGSGRHQF